MSAQLALYRAVLARIYPEKTMRAALIFTEGPRLIEVPGAGDGRGACRNHEQNAGLAEVTLR